MISEIYVGELQKILHVIDKSSGIVAQYFLDEIGCPLSEGVTSCNKFFLSFGVRCDSDVNLQFNKSTGKCECKPGYFRT